MLELANFDKTAVGGVITISQNSPVYKLVNSNMSPAAGWIVLIVGLALFAAVSLTGAARRRRRGLSAPPLSVTVLGIVITAIGGIVLVLVIVCIFGYVIVTQLNHR